MSDDDNSDSSSNFEEGGEFASDNDAILTINKLIQKEIELRNFVNIKVPILREKRKRLENLNNKIMDLKKEITMLKKKRKEDKKELSAFRKENCVKYIELRSECDDYRKKLRNNLTIIAEVS